jgi:hypothetical protein
MADLGFDGNVKVTFAPTITNISAPTVAELNAGVDLEDRLLPDGLATPSDTGEVDNSKLGSTFSTAVAGRRSFSGLMVKYVRGPVSDTLASDVEDALVYRATGYLVVRRDVDAGTAWAAAQRVEVYPVQCKNPNPDSPAPDTLQAVEVGMTLTAEPKAFGDWALVAA